MPGSLQAECLPVPSSLLGCGSRVWRLWHSSGVSAAGRLERELREMAPARAVSGETLPHLPQEGFSSPVPWALPMEPGEDSSAVSCCLSLCVLLCLQGERGMPGLPGRHGSKVPCEHRSDACLPDLTPSTPEAQALCVCVCEPVTVLS